MNFEGKSKLKNITVEDVAYAGREKNKVFMQTTEHEATENVALKQEMDIKIELTLTESDRRKTYNKNITKLDERYSKCTPLGAYIVRLFIMEDEITKSGLLLPSLATTRAKTNQGIGDKIEDPFRFKQTAVIVAVPKHENELKPGDIVQIVKPRPAVDVDQVVGYEYEYVHHTYNFERVPTNVQDPDFGYAIVPRTVIKVIVNENN